MARLGSPLAVIALFLSLSVTLTAQTGLWTTQNIPNGIPTLRDIDMFDENFGMAVGESDIRAGMGGYSGVMWTTNGGNTWYMMESMSPRFDPELPAYTSWHGVHVVDAQNAWIVGDSAMVYTTRDAGRTWTQQLVDWDTLQYASRPTLYDVYMVNTTRGVIVGGDNVSASSHMSEFHPPQLFRTFNGGQHWLNDSPYPPNISNNYGAIRCIDYANGTFLYGGEYGLLLMDQGSGLQVVQPIGKPNIDFIHWSDVDIQSPTEIFMVGRNWLYNQPVAYRTIRQGTRFSNMVPGNIVLGVDAISQVEFLNPDDGWIASSQQYLALSNDQGSTWTNFQVGSLPPAIPMTGMDMVNSLAGWACGGTEGGNDSYIIRFYGSPPKADISTTDILLEFGTVECERLVEKELFIRNSGTGDLKVSLGDITFNSPDFEVVNTQDFPLTIRPKRSASVIVRWRPSSALTGDLVAVMNINSNDPDHNPWQVELRGTRQAGRLDLYTEYSISYGTCIGDTLYYDIPVYASGNRPPTFIKYEFVSGHNDFRLMSPAAGTVIPDYESFTVRFAPKDSAMRRGVYRFIHGNPTCPDTSLVAFTGLGQMTVLQASATTIDFGQICAGQVKDTTITLTNHGNTWASLGILEHVSGDPLFSSPDFTLFIKQDSSKTYHLRFTPYSAGAFEGRYRATYGLCEDTLFFTFKGEGLETKLEFDPKSPVRIGPIFANRVAGQTVTISNPGKTPANITDIRFSKILPPLQFSSLPRLPLTLAPGQVTTVGLRFSPTQVGEYNTSLIVEWDARCADSAEVDINALCVPNPAIEAPASADLGVQTCPAPLRDTIMIRNKGNGPLVFYSVSVTGPDFTHFNVIQPKSNDTAKAGSSYPMLVEFNRPTAGRSNAIIRLTHNDFEAGRTDIAVTAERTVSEYVIEGDSATAFFTRLFVPETRQFTIRNIGSGPLTVTDVRVVRAASVFSVTPLQTLPVTLPPNGSTTFEVQFVPNARGPFTGVIEVESDPCTNIHALTLTGSGDTDGLSPDRGDIDFVLDPCSYTPACENVVLKNQSPEPVEVLGLTITQSGTVFSIDPAISTPFVMASNAERTVRVCASPAVQGLAQGTLVITSNDPAYPTLSVALRATRDSSGVTVSETSLDFGRLADCMTTSPRRITITNTGTLRETVSFAFANGGTAFSSTMTADETINPGRSFSFDVDFTRPGYGVFDDEVVLTVQRCGTEYRIPLHAELVEQKYVLAPNPLSFPTVNVGGTATRQFTLQNAGGFNATIARISVQPSGVFSLSGSVPSTIAAGGTENVGLRFSPTAEGDFTADICVIISAPCPDTLCIRAEGRAVRGTLEVQPPLLAFGTRAQCEAGTLFDTLRNSGSGPISIISASITGGGAAAFSNLTPVGAPEVVSAGGMRIFEIRYDPAMAPGDGAVNAALTVQTDDAVLPQFDIPLEAGRVTLRADAGGSVDFGPVQIGNPEVRSVTLRNTGSTTLCYTAADFPPQLAVLPAPPFCIDPGGTRDLQLTLTATASGLFSGRLVLHVDAPCEDSTVFTLSARGEQGTLVQIDTVRLGTSPWCEAVTGQFTIRSTYLEDVTLESVTMEGPDAALFSILTPTVLPQVIAAGSSLPVEIAFAADRQTRDYTATFVSRFTAFGSQIERRTVLVGRRVVPTISVTGASYPQVVVGQSGGTQNLTITNTSELPLTVDLATLQLPDFVLLSINPAPPATLQPGGTIRVEVEFIPQSAGMFTDSLVVSGTQPCDFGASGRLTGEGIPQPIVDAVLSIGAVEAEADAVIDIPISTDSDLGSAEVSGWAGSIRFNRSMLWPMEMVTEGSLSAGMQVGFTYDNANGEVSITATGGRVSAGTGALAWLRCRVLIGNALSTPLRMSDDFGFTGGFASVAGRVDGSFELINYCLPGDRLVDVAGGLLLRQNTPNPVSLGSSGSTEISYSLPDDATVTLEIFDMIGREIRTVDRGLRTRGSHSIRVDISALRPGTYMYVLRTATASAVRRMVVVP